MAGQFKFNSLIQLRTHLDAINKDIIKHVFILFTGDKDQPNEQSWCPDCNVADPVIKKHVATLNEDSQFLTCFVGKRPA